MLFKLIKEALQIMEKEWDWNEGSRMPAISYNVKANVTQCTSPLFSTLLCNSYTSQAEKSSSPL